MVTQLTASAGVATIRPMDNNDRPTPPRPRYRANGRLTFAEKELARNQGTTPGWSWTHDPSALYHGRMQSGIVHDRKVIQREGN